MMTTTLFGIKIPEKYVRILWGKLCPKGCNKFMAVSFNPSRYLCMDCGYEELR